MTINKSQGQSLKCVGLYFSGQVFTHGQVYVALSRVTEREGLVIVNADKEMRYHTLIKNIVYKEIFSNIQCCADNTDMTSGALNFVASIIIELNLFV